MGHRHIRVDTVNTLLKPKGSNIVQVERPAAFCGSYRNDYSPASDDNDNYVLRSGLLPSIAGGYTVELNPLLNRIKLIRD